MNLRNPGFASLRRAAASVGAAVAATLALAACSTPVARQSVEVPKKFAAAAATDKRTPASSEREPEAAWWESFGDPVLTDLIRRAAYENRDEIGRASGRER